MRTTPLIGKKACFGPRRFGWGLDPVSPEGWVVIGGMVALSIAGKRGIVEKSTQTKLMAPLVVALVLKGTSPGGPKARRRFLEARTGGGS